MPLVALRSREIRLAARPSGVPVPTDFELAEVEVPEPGRRRGARPQRVRLGRPVHAWTHERRRVVRAAVRARRAAHGRRGRAGRRLAATTGGRRAWVVHDLGLARARRSPTGAACGASIPRSARLDRARRARDARADRVRRVVDIGQVAAGETVFVSGAAGAVGSIAAQLAQHARCARDRQRGLGREGRLARGARLRRRLRLHDDGRPQGRLREPPPTASTCTSTTSAARRSRRRSARLRLHGRVVACGAISHYNATERAAGPAQPLHARHEAAADRGVHRLRPLRPDPPRSSPRSAARGRRDDPATARRSSTGSSTRRRRSSGCCRGENIGKMLVRVGPEPRAREAVPLPGLRPQGARRRKRFFLTERRRALRALRERVRIARRRSRRGSETSTVGGERHRASTATCAPDDPAVVDRRVTRRRRARAAEARHVRRSAAGPSSATCTAREPTTIAVGERRGRAACSGVEMPKPA